MTAILSRKSPFDGLDRLIALLFDEPPHGGSGLPKEINCTEQRFGVIYGNNPNATKQLQMDLLMIAASYGCVEYCCSMYTELCKNGGALLKEPAQFIYTALNPYNAASSRKNFPGADKEFLTYFHRTTGEPITDERFHKQYVFNFQSFKESVNFTKSQVFITEELRMKMYNELIPKEVSLFHSTTSAVCLPILCLFVGRCTTAGILGDDQLFPCLVAGPSSNHRLLRLSRISNKYRDHDQVGDALIDIFSNRDSLPSMQNVSLAVMPYSAISKPNQGTRAGEDELPTGDNDPLLMRPIFSADACGDSVSDGNQMFASTPSEEQLLTLISVLSCPTIHNGLESATVAAGTGGGVADSIETVDQGNETTTETGEVGTMSTLTVGKEVQRTIKEKEGIAFGYDAKLLSKEGFDGWSRVGFLLQHALYIIRQRFDGLCSVDGWIRLYMHLKRVVFVEEKQELVFPRLPRNFRELVARTICLFHCLTPVRLSIVDGQARVAAVLHCLLGVHPMSSARGKDVDEWTVAFPLNLTPEDAHVCPPHDGFWTGMLRSSPLHVLVPSFPSPRTTEQNDNIVQEANPLSGIVMTCLWQYSSSLQSSLESATKKSLLDGLLNILTDERLYLSPHIPVSGREDSLNAFGFKRAFVYEKLMTFHCPMIDLWAVVLAANHTKGKTKSAIESSSHSGFPTTEVVFKKFNKAFPSLDKFPPYKYPCDLFTVVLLVFMATPNEGTMSLFRKCIVTEFCGTRNHPAELENILKAVFFKPANISEPLAEGCAKGTAIVTGDTFVAKVGRTFFGSCW